MRLRAGNLRRGAWPTVGLQEGWYSIGVYNYKLFICTIFCMEKVLICTKREHYGTSTVDLRNFIVEEQMFTSTVTLLLRVKQTQSCF